MVVYNLIGKKISVYNRCRICFIFRRGYVGKSRLLKGEGWGSYRDVEDQGLALTYSLPCVSELDHGIAIDAER